jgi:hypothetical protein
MCNIYQHTTKNKTPNHTIQNNTTQHDNKMPYRISLQTRFERTNDESTERDPTIEEYDEFMKNDKRYKDFINELFYNEDVEVSNIEYINGGIIEFTTDTIKIPKYGDNYEDITDFIYEFPYADTIYEGLTAIYPTEETKHLKYPDWCDELGVINCTEPFEITVTEIE